MASNTKWAAFTAAALATAGGLLTAADPHEPSAAQPGSRPGARPAARAPLPKEPPEPAWMAGFREAYELKDGEVVKRVPRPLPPERAEFYLTHASKALGIEREAAARRGFARTGDYFTLLVEQDGRRLGLLRTVSSAYLRERPELRRGENLLTAWALIQLVTGREEPEVVIDPRSKDDPLFAGRNLTVSGDFVVRRNAPLDQLAPQLEAVLRTGLKLDVRLTLKAVEQPVYVVGGTFKLAPPPWRAAAAKEVDVYATPEGLNKEYEFAKHDRGREQARAVATKTFDGTPTDFVRFVGSRVNARMVWDADLPAGPEFSWHNHTVLKPTKEQAAVDRDPERVLRAVSEQTGLTFKKEVRRVPVLSASAADR